MYIARVEMIQENPSVKGSYIELFGSSKRVGRKHHRANNFSPLLLTQNEFHESKNKRKCSTYTVGVLAARKTSH